MSLARKAIRRWVVACLIGATAAGDRVFDSPPGPSWRGQGAEPQLRVFALGEEATLVGETQNTYDRVLRLGIEGLVQGSGSVSAADLADDLADQVERWIIPRLRCVRFEGFKLGAAEDGLDSVDLDILQDGNPKHASFRVVLSITYRVSYPEDELGNLADLEQVAVTYDIPPPGGDPASDTIQPELT